MARSNPTPKFELILFCLTQFIARTPIVCRLMPHTIRSKTTPSLPGGHNERNGMDFIIFLFLIHSISIYFPTHLSLRLMQITVIQSCIHK